MQLHEACRTRLIECVEKGLQEAKFKNRNILDYSSFRSLDSCASALPTKIQEQVGGWISDHPIRDFSYGFVGEKRSSYAEKLNSLSKEDFPVGLPEISDVNQMSIQLVDSLLTLPRDYTVVLPFVTPGSPLARADFDWLRVAPPPGTTRARNSDGDCVLQIRVPSKSGQSELSPTQ